MTLIFGVRSTLLSHPDPVPIGSVMLFHQDAAPDGWVKDVAATLDNAALRIVTSTAWASGKAGATAFDSVFASGKLSDNYTLLVADSPAHNHTGTYVTTAGGGVAGVLHEGANASAGTQNVPAQGGDGAHQHGLTLDLNYVNFILCTKL